MELSLQRICPGSAEGLQDTLNQDHFPRFLTKKEWDWDYIFTATDESTIPAQKETRATDQPFPNAQLAFISQGMTNLKAWLLNRVGIDTQKSIEDIVYHRLGEDVSEGDNLLVDFYKKVACIEMMSVRSVAKSENAANNAVMSDDKMGLIAEEVARLDQ